VESDWVEKEWWGRNKRLYKKINKVRWRYKKRSGG